MNKMGLWIYYQFKPNVPISNMFQNYQYLIKYWKGKAGASQITEFENLTPGPKLNSEQFQPSQMKYKINVFWNKLIRFEAHQNAKNHFT